MAPGERSKFDAPMIETDVFQKQMYCMKKVPVTLLGLFGAPIMTRRPGNCAPLVVPLP